MIDKQDISRVVENGLCHSCGACSGTCREDANSQSGGVASELLIHALLSKDISGAVIVTMNPGTNPRQEAYIASSEEEIVAAQKSKYVPVPLLDVLGRLEHFPGAVAIVGLSCHMHGLIKALEQLCVRRT